MRRLLIACWLGVVMTAPLQAQTTVFAAASLADVLPALAERAGPAGRDLQFVFAASSTLARQVESGANAALFISADDEWVRYLVERHLIEPDSERDLAGNVLVLIAPADSGLTARPIDRELPLREWLGEGRLALGDPAHVPAGRYTQAALTQLGLWESVKLRLAPADSVRTALRYVVGGECPLGVVYRTDTLRVREIRTLGEFPATLHAPIRYKAVLVKSAADTRGREFLEFLHSTAAREVWAAHGFTP